MQSFSCPISFTPLRPNRTWQFENSSWLAQLCNDLVSRLSATTIDLGKIPRPEIFFQRFFACVLQSFSNHHQMRHSVSNWVWVFPNEHLHFPALIFKRNNSHIAGCMRRSPLSHCCHVLGDEYNSFAASVCVRPASSRTLRIRSGSGLLPGAAFLFRFRWGICSYEIRCFLAKAESL